MLFESKKYLFFPVVIYSLENCIPKDKYCKAYKESTWSVIVPSGREKQVKKGNPPQESRGKKELNY